VGKELTDRALGIMRPENPRALGRADGRFRCLFPVAARNRPVFFVVARPVRRVVLVKPPSGGHRQEIEPRKKGARCAVLEQHDQQAGSEGHFQVPFTIRTRGEPVENSPLDSG
jgi:hypothetical protein